MADNTTHSNSSNITTDLFRHEHWAARSKRFPMNDATCKMTCYESDYLVVECNQDMNGLEMSMAWLVKQLHGDKRHWMVSLLLIVSVFS